MTPLSNIGNIPVDMAVLGSMYPAVCHINEKARSLEASGAIIRLKKGLYVASESETGTPLSRELIANHLYGPSYVSREYALRYYGLIPERVHVLTSMTTKQSRKFENATGHYEYEKCSSEYFTLGVKMQQADGVSFLMASPEKALCDVVNYTRGLKLRFMKDVGCYFEEDIRLDTDELDEFDLGLMQLIASQSRRQSSINTIIKYIKHVRHIR